MADKYRAVVKALQHQFPEGHTPDLLLAVKGALQLIEDMSEGDRLMVAWSIFTSVTTSSPPLKDLCPGCLLHELENSAQMTRTPFSEIRPRH